MAFFLLIGWANNRRAQISDTKYQFANHSGASAYGIMGQIDGDSLTAASLEETDDMPHDRLMSRFLPMLGSARRLGSNLEADHFKPQVRITGVFKGADALQSLIDSGQYHLLPIMDVHLGIELGIIHPSFMLQMRAELPTAEYIRQFLCRNVSARNLIWEKHIRRAMAIGLQPSLGAVEPMPGERYKRKGIISFGYDHTGHGENDQASKSALVVSEQVGNFVTFPFVKTWRPGTDDKDLELDLFSLWDYFRPDVAIGDAYGVGMLTGLNDRLYRAGLTDIDRRTIGDGESKGSTWPEWAFAPLRFEGMTKHSMATALRNVFHNGRAAIPYMEEAFPQVTRESGVIVMPPALSSLANLDDEFVLFVRQLANMKPVKNKTGGSYDSYKMSDIKIGDDLFDAACAGVWALATRGAELVPAVIGSRTQTREQLLGVRSAS